MSSSEIDPLKLAFGGSGVHWSTFIIWAKDRFTLGRSDYQRQHEILLYEWREAAPQYCAEHATKASLDEPTIKPNRFKRGMTYVFLLAPVATIMPFAYAAELISWITMAGVQGTVRSWLRIETGQAPQKGGFLARSE